MTPTPSESTPSASTPGERVPDPGPEDVEALQAEIEKTRQALGETVEALSAKTDVKARVSAKTDRAKHRIHEAATDASGDLKPVIPAGVAAIALVVAGIVALLVWRKRGR